MIKKIMTWSFCSLLTLSSILGQQETYIGIAGNQLIVDFSSLNTQIRGEYPELNNIITEFRLEGIAFKSRASIGYYASLSGIPIKNKGQKQTLFNGYGAGITYTYNLIPKRRFELFPKVAFGARRYKLILGETSNPVSVADILNTPIENYKFTNWGTYLELGLGGNINFKIKTTHFLVGINAGYRFDSGKWVFDDANSVYGEISNLSGFFIGIGTKMWLLKTKQKNS